MKPLALFVIQSDPRTNGRAVEALRMAVGIAAWKRVDVAVYLGGPAVLAAGENADDLVGADDLVRYTPLLSELGRPVFIDRESGHALINATVPIQALDRTGLAKLAAESTYLLKF